MYFQVGIGLVIKFLKKMVNEKFLLIPFIFILWSINIVYSDPPPLPPSLPKLENSINSQNINSLPNSSQQSVDSKKDSDNENSDVDSFIDLGNNKLPNLGKNPIEDLKLDELKLPDLKKDNISPSLLDDGKNPTQKISSPVPESSVIEPQINKPILVDDSLKPQVTVPIVPVLLPATIAPNKEQESDIDKPINNIEEDIDTATPLQKENFIAPQTSIPNALPIMSEKNTKSEIKASPIISKPPLIGDEKLEKPKAQTLVPVFVKPNEFNKDIEKKDNDLVKEEATEKTLIKQDSSTNTVNSEEKSSELTTFIQNEVQMLLLPNDDMVLGKLTEEAKLEQMDIYSFIQMFKKIYDSQNREKQKIIIDNFIDNYDSDFHINHYVPANNVIYEAFDAVKKDNLFALRALLDNYPIIQRRKDDQNTLLDEAIKANHYYIAKFLIIRGININALDSNCRTALEISATLNDNINCLIKKALGYTVYSKCHDSD